MPVCPKCRQTGPELGASCPHDDYYFVDESALETAERDRRIGTLLADRFVILDQISEGGMGAVYLALQLPVRREVALKVLRAELERSHKTRQRFIREARAISQLSHPNIITLHDFGFDEYDQPYMVMEYAPGKELSDWAQSPDLTTRRIVSVNRQLLSALAEAHDQGIVHRDLKPQNVIVTHTAQRGDFPKLLDFGIARLVNKETTHGLTADGEVFGTPHYMSPEQARGGGEIGPEADVYAMGIILYECCTGDVPFDADSPLSVLFMHINEPMPEPVPRDTLELPEGLATVIYRATEKEADDRYANAGEMLAAFDEALGLTTETGSLSISGRFPSAKSKGGDDGDDAPVSAQSGGVVPELTTSADISDAVEDERGGTLRTHQLDGDADESEPASEQMASEVASRESQPAESAPVTSQLATSEAAEPSSPSLGLIVVGTGVLAAMLIVAIVAVVVVGLSDDSAADEELVGEADEAALAQADDGVDEADDGAADDEVEAPDSDDDEPVAEDAEEVESDDSEEAVSDTDDEDEEEYARARESGDDEPVEEVGASGGGDSGERAPEPAGEAPSSPPEETEPAVEEPDDETSDEDDEEVDSDEEFEPGKFERPAADTDDGPTKFQRPDEIGQ